MSLKQFPDVEALSVRDKLALVDDLWLSVSGDLEGLEVTDREREILDQRWEEFLKAPDSALTIDEFKSRLAKARQ
jgi:putative addiction module component (TIGR02574 family)